MSANVNATRPLRRADPRQPAPAGVHAQRARRLDDAAGARGHGRGSRARGGYLTIVKWRVPTVSVRPGRPQAPDVCASLRQSLAPKQKIPHAGRPGNPALEHHLERRITLPDHKQPLAREPQNGPQRADPEPARHHRRQDARRDALSPTQKEIRNAP